MIINSDYKTLTIIEDNKLFFRQINEYNILKHKDFEGKRIMIKLNDDTEVLETFNNGIFNVRHKNKNLQLHDKRNSKI